MINDDVPVISSPEDNDQGYHHVRPTTAVLKAVDVVLQSFATRARESKSVRELLMQECQGGISIITDDIACVKALRWVMICKARRLLTIVTDLHTLLCSWKHIGKE